MNAPAVIGHNNPPDPLNDAMTQFADLFGEVENWLDGEEVENEAQMKAVDALIKSLKDAEKEVKDSKEDEYRPHKEACDLVVARWKPLLDDMDRMKKGLTGIVGKFKTKLAAQKAEAERKAREEAERKAREAAAALRQADMKNIEERREADRLAAEAREAERAAQAIAKDKVKGLRTFWAYDIEDMTAFMRWMWVNDKPALETFANDYMRRTVGNGQQKDGVREFQEKRAV